MLLIVKTSVCLQEAESKTRRKKIRLRLCHVCVDVRVLGGIIVSWQLPTFDGFGKAALLYLWRLSLWRQSLASASALRDKPAEKRKREARYQTGHSSTPPLPIPEIRGERGKVQMKENLHVAISRSLQKQTDPKTSRGEDKGNEEEEEREQTEGWKKDLLGNGPLLMVQAGHYLVWVLVTRVKSFQRWMNVITQLFQSSRDSLERFK